MNAFIRTRLSVRAAALTLIILLGLAILYHISVITGVIPYDMTWGGRLQNQAQMLIFESISILIGLTVLLVTAMKARLIRVWLPISVINAIVWVLLVLFVLNTIGNLFALNNLETIIFTPVTFISALMCYRLVLEK